MRPGHVHLRVTAPGFQLVTTHAFVAGDPYLGSDAAFAVKDELIVEPLQITDPLSAAARRSTRLSPQTPRPSQGRDRRRRRRVWSRIRIRERSLASEHRPGRPDLV